jgi:DnaJ-class molecular chaperone
LAAEWHPDKCPGGDVEKCREEFPKYANAYEILSNSEMRKNYDYVLANPCARRDADCARSVAAADGCAVARRAAGTSSPVST